MNKSTTIINDELIDNILQMDMDYFNNNHRTKKIVWPEKRYSEDILVWEEYITEYKTEELHKLSQIFKEKFNKEYSDSIWHLEYSENIHDSLFSTEDKEIEADSNTLDFSILSHDIHANGYFMIWYNDEYKSDVFINFALHIYKTEEKNIFHIQKFTPSEMSNIEGFVDTIIEKIREEWY